MKKWIRYSWVFLLLVSCHRAPTTLETPLVTPAHPREIQREKGRLCSLPSDFSCSPFSPLTPEERCQDWGKELTIGYAFAEEFDLYRAITSFKRALWFLPPEYAHRETEIQYAIALSYYLGKKYVDVVRTAQQSTLALIDESFPAYHDFLILLYDSYSNIGECDLADEVFARIEVENPKAADKLVFFSLLETGNLQEAADFGMAMGCGDYLNGIVTNFRSKAKSTRTAEMLNALLPGAGYWYVGQQETAVTAFLVNGLFIGAAAYFFHDGNIAAGLITLSFESGWYFGGIYGGGLAAKCYNERLYTEFAERIACKEKLYPLVMLKFSF